MPLATIEPGVLTICAYMEFPPFTYEADGETGGTEIELLKSLAAINGVSIPIRKQAFINLRRRPGLDGCDVAAAEIAALPNREVTPSSVWSIP